MAGLVSLAVLWPHLALAQGERYGTIAGTWEDCQQKLQGLRERQAELADSGKERASAYVQRRLLTELDRCVNFENTPLADYTLLISAYAEFGMDERALELTARGFERYGQANGLLLLAGKLLYKRGDVERGIAVLEELFEASPSEIDAAQILANHYYKNGEYRRSIRFMQRVASARPKDFAANAALGDACLQAGNLRCAGRAFALALSLDPTNVLLAIKLGDLQRKRKEYGAALNAYSKAIEAAPDRTDARIGFGRTLLDAELLEAAAASLVDTSNRDPGSFEAARFAATALRRLDREIMGVILTGRAMDKGDAADMNTGFAVERMLSLVATRRPEEALTFARTEQVAQLEDPQGRIAAAVADALLGSGKLQPATLQLEALTKKHENQWQYEVRLARVYMLDSKWGAARERLAAQDIENNPYVEREWAHLHLTEARSMKIAGKALQARALIQQARKRAPNSALLASAEAVLSPSEELGNYQASLAELGEGVPPSTRAWVALHSGAPKKALEALEELEKPSPRERVLRAAAYLRAEAPEAALAEAKAVRTGPLRDVARARVAESYAQLSDKMLRSDAVDEGVENAERALESSATDTPLASWATRARFTGLAVRGKLRLKKKELEALDPNNTLDVLLIASGTPGSDKGLALLKKSDSPAAKKLLTEKAIRVASSLFRKGKWSSARKVLPPQADRAQLTSSKSIVNAAIIEHYSSPSTVQRVLAPYAEKGIPEAMWAVALAQELSGGGRAPIELLEKLNAKNATGSMGRTAKALLNLKRALYRRSGSAPVGRLEAAP